MITFRMVVVDLADYERFPTGRLTKVDGVASIPIRRVKGPWSR